MEIGAYEQRLVDLHLDPGAIDGKFDGKLTYAVQAIEKILGWQARRRDRSAVRRRARQLPVPATARARRPGGGRPRRDRPRPAGAHRLQGLPGRARSRRRPPGAASSSAAATTAASTRSRRRGATCSSGTSTVGAKAASGASTTRGTSTVASRCTATTRCPPLPRRTAAHASRCTSPSTSATSSTRTWPCTCSARRHAPTGGPLGSGGSGDTEADATTDGTARDGRARHARAASAAGHDADHSRADDRARDRGAAGTTRAVASPRADAAETARQARARGGSHGHREPPRARDRQPRGDHDPRRDRARRSPSMTNDGASPGVAEPTPDSGPGADGVRFDDPQGTYHLDIAPDWRAVDTRARLRRRVLGGRRHGRRRRSTSRRRPSARSTSTSTCNS